MDRRKFIYGFARGGILAALAVLSGVLISRKQISLQEDCTDNFQCRNCRKQNTCSLPEANNTTTHGEEEKG